MKNYNEKYFKSLDYSAKKSAKAIIPLLLDVISPSSVIDVGCGTGAWLAVFMEHGIDDIQGLDGTDLNPNLLQIPNDCFITVNLEKRFLIERQFDLAVSLEVAEHLPEIHAEDFIKSLTRLSPVILFSAAIPFQGGTHHVNEQWPEYWINLFDKHGYIVIDCLRNKIWNDDKVDWWYAQNCFLFVDAKQISRYPALEKAWKNSDQPPNNLVHPKKFLELLNERNFWIGFAELHNTIPSSESFIVLEDGHFYDNFKIDNNAIHFLDSGQVFAGEIASDRKTIQEIDRLRQKGIGYLVLFWNVFPWIEKIDVLKEYLSEFDLIFESERIIIILLSRP